MTEWDRKDFGRRHYYVTGPDLEKAKKIEVLVRVDGQTLVHVQAREPGIVAVVSQPSAQGVDIEIIEPRVAFTDVRVPPREGEVPAWAFEALGLE